jgi:O-acetylserine/cysteine efflux transporter
MTPGLASLIIQFQAFATIGLSAFIFSEKIALKTGIGLGLALCGLGIIAAHLEAKITLLGLVLNLAGAISWSISNIMTKQANLKPQEGLGFTVWSSVYALGFMVVLTLLFEGYAQDYAALSTASLRAWLAAIWQGPANVVIGFSIWNSHLSRFPSTKVTPFGLLVPIIGMVSSALMLAENFPTWKIAACLCVLLGLLINSISFSTRSNPTKK